MTEPLTKILFIGDIIGSPGREAVARLLPGLLRQYQPDAVIANGENAAGGFGITPKIFDDLMDLKIDVVTTGNHVWDRKEIIEYLRRDEFAKKDEIRLIRPANYPPGTPGSGWAVFKTNAGVKVAVLNLSGRIFMDAIDCPFRTAEECVKKIREETGAPPAPVIILDMHAETTSEKAAMGWFMDGSVSAVIGTHTHVQTSDERILPNGTAFITDAGMTGPVDSVIGMKRETIIETFLTKMPGRFEVADEGLELQGVFVAAGSQDGRARKIERIRLKAG